MKREMKKVTAVLLICVFSLISTLSCFADQSANMFYTIYAGTSSVMVHAHSLDNTKCTSIKYTATVDAVVDIRGYQTTRTLTVEDEVTDTNYLHTYVSVSSINSEINPAAHMYAISLQGDVTIDYEVTFADGSVETYSITQAVK